MAKTLFISADYIKKNYINFNIEDKELIPAIEIEQDINFERVLGTTLYNTLQTQASAGTLTANNQILIEDHIQKSLMYFVLSRLTFKLGLKFHQKGVGEMSSENEKPKDFEEIKYYSTDLRNIGEYYIQRLVNFLKANYTLYQDYAQPGSGWDIIQPRKSSSYFGGMHLPRFDMEYYEGRLLEGLPPYGKENLYIYRGGL